jgi:hypothetical protein
MAAETGVPATLALLVLVMLAAWKSFRGIRLGRDRALRTACLVAALLVPIHGFFDVPGHRISLALSAVFLFALSLHPPTSEPSISMPRLWRSRLLALCLLAISVSLIRAQWLGGRQPALTSAAHAIMRAQQLHREDLALQKAAFDAGREHQPDPAEDKIEQALATLDAVKPLAPLNRHLLRYEAYYALHFDDKYERVDRAFAIDRALAPTSVVGPLRQAQAWAPTHPQKAAELTQETLRRAAAVETVDPDNPANTSRTRQRIRQFSKGVPELEAWAD